MPARDNRWVTCILALSEKKDCTFVSFELTDFEDLIGYSVQHEHNRQNTVFYKSGFFLASFLSDLNFFSVSLSSTEDLEGLVLIRFFFGIRAFSSFNFSFSMASS